MHSAPATTRARALCAAVLALAALAPVSAAPRRAGAPPPAGRGAEGATWEPIRRVFGQRGEAEDGYFKITLPRTDLHVRIAGDALDPGFEFTSYLGFVPMGDGRVMAMGEVVLAVDEVPSALAAAHRQDVTVSALHNHLLGESPRIVYMHVMAEGAPGELAQRLRAVYAATGTPLGPPSEERPTGDWSAVDAVLGPHAEASGRIAEYEFARHGPLRVGGMAVRSSGLLETASEAVFQRLPGAPGHVASTGELFVAPTEVDPVVRALDANGLHVTAVHNHMVDDSPQLFWIHWYATGDAVRLARGAAAALARMNGDRRSHGEGGDGRGR